MLRKAPPLESIEIFVAAARGDSFRTVARQLALSPSAVSRRIATLEDFLGVALFDRSLQSQRLNATGQKYLASVEPAIAAIQRASVELGPEASGQLRVATSHSFAAAWLIPRLADLHQALGLEVDIITSRDFDVVRSGEAHVGIWGGLDVPADMVAEKLTEAEVFPVCAPILAGGRLPPIDDSELPDHLLLSVQTPTRLWERWFANGAATPAPPFKTREFAALYLMYEAAACGVGIALALPLIAAPFLKSGRLVRCSRHRRAIGETYKVYHARRRDAQSPGRQAFVRWLHTQVGQSLRAESEFAQI